jgi:hypothetical protein
MGNWKQLSTKKGNIMKNQNVEISIKLKSDSITTSATIHRSECGGMFIGEDWYERSEFDYNEEEERFYAKDGSIQIQL